MCGGGGGGGDGMVVVLLVNACQVRRVEGAQCGRRRRACAMRGGTGRGGGEGALRRGRQYRRECRTRRAHYPPLPVYFYIT